MTTLTTPQSDEITADDLIKPSGVVIAHSVTADGDEVVTFEAWMHRFVLAEFNTHRVVVKNSASSRAIPVAKQIDMLVKNPAYPLVWPNEQRGMQGGEPLDQDSMVMAQTQWNGLLKAALKVAGELRNLGLHKSLTNRLLEPFMWHKVVCTASAWDNFYRQRDEAQAQPEIRAVAASMRAAHAASTPVLLAEGQWHTPYVSDRDRDEVQARLATAREDDAVALTADEHGIEQALARISSARCARTSYLTNPVIDAETGQVVEEAKVDLTKDIGLYDRLVAEEPRHWSPLEHPCTPWAANKQVGLPPLTFDIPGQHGNRVRYTVPTDHLPRVGPIYGYRTLRTEVETLLGDVTYR